MLNDLAPEQISKTISAKGSKAAKPPSELEISKEARLASKEKRLAGGSAAGTGAAAASAMPPPPPPVDKSALLDQITAYRERFPQLKKRNNVSAKSTAEDLQDELHYIEMQLGSRQDGNFGALILHGTMLGIETLHRDVWNPFNLNLNGLGKVTKDNMSEFQPILDELMIKYGTGMYMGPELRLCLSVGALVMTVHAANSGDPKIAVALDRMNKAANLPTADTKDL